MVALMIVAPIVIASAVWVFFDAAGRPTVDRVNEAAAVLLLWVVAFPAWLYRRGRNPKGPRPDKPSPGIAPGWFVDPNDPEFECWWTGYGWVPQWRPARQKPSAAS